MTRSRKILWSLCLLTGPCLASAQALSIPVRNASFEDNFAPDGGFPVLVPAGWSLHDPAGIVDQGTNAVGVLNPAGTTFFNTPVPDGRNAALIYLEQGAGTTSPGDPVGLFQTLTTSLQADMVYDLTVAVGNIASGTGLGAFAGFGFSDLSGFPGYRIELLAGGEVIAFDQDSVSIAEGQFATASAQVHIGAEHPRIGQALGIRLIHPNTTGNLVERAREVDFDQVQLLATPVPEPATYAMWLAGIGLLSRAHPRLRRPVRSA